MSIFPGDASTEFRKRSIKKNEQSASFDDQIEETLQSAFSAILSGEREPVYLICYPDTPKVCMAIAKEISKLYGAFLTSAMHEEDICEILKQKGVWLEKKCTYHRVVTASQISLFIGTLERELLQSFENRPGGIAWVHLGYDYGPTSPILETVFQKRGLNADFYYLLPYKSHTHIHFKDGEIVLNIHFKGPLI
ncbi:MAG: hypothetical protein ACOYK9_04280 [Chlamydiia bacterium]